MAMQIGAAQTIIMSITLMRGYRFFWGVIGPPPPPWLSAIFFAC